MLSLWLTANDANSFCYYLCVFQRLLFRYQKSTLLFRCLEAASRKTVDGVMHHGPHARIKTTGGWHQCKGVIRARREIWIIPELCPLPPLPLKVGSHVPQLPWERRPCCEAWQWIRMQNLRLILSRLCTKVHVVCRPLLHVVDNVPAQLSISCFIPKV